MTTRIALVGFGHVGRAFAHLLLQKREVLRSEYGIDAVVTAILTRHHGWAREDAGLDLEALVSQVELPNHDSRPLIAALSADVLVEVSTLDVHTGQPALDHVRDAIRSGMHVVTANKGPIAQAYRELGALARERSRSLRFEATLADDLPVFNLVRYALPAARVLRLRGIVNSTTNYLLSEAARGTSFARALAQARRLGIAEPDSSNDLDGWDAAAKATILANVLLNSGLRIDDVRRTPITPAVGKQAAAAARRGKRVRPLVTVTRDGATFAPATLSPDDPLFAVDGFSMALELETDVAGRLVVSLHDPHVEQTAFALLADLVDVARERGTNIHGL